MPNERFAETDPEEIEYSKYVFKLLKQVEVISTELDKHGDTQPGSRLEADDKRTPHYPVASYGYAQLLAAIGCLESLSRMIVREDEGKKAVEIVAGPYGSYALVRNALDCAGTALWLLEPESSTGRVKRRIMLEVDEVKNGAALRESTGERSWKKWRDDYRKRLQEVAVQAEIADWDPLGKTSKPPTMTETLKTIERYHQEPIMSWLSAWQLASGHAHGKQWAQIASQQLDEIADTRTEIGATFRVSIRYGMLAVVLRASVQLVEAAMNRYMDLLSPRK